MTRHLEIKETRAAELSGMMIGKSDKTVREWKQQFFENQLVRALMGNTKAIACNWHCPDQMETAMKSERSSKGEGGGLIPGML